MSESVIIGLSFYKSDAKNPKPNSKTRNISYIESLFAPYLRGYVTMQPCNPQDMKEITTTDVQCSIISAWLDSEEKVKITTDRPVVLCMDHITSIPRVTERTTNAEISVEVIDRPQREFNFNKYFNRVMYKQNRCRLISPYIKTLIQ